MRKALIIVESPAKIKTLKKFLGREFRFESSIGHIRDLPEKEFGIDIENDFEPKYVVMPEKEKVISALQKAAKECDTVYLSPDPDREGEAIAWHITKILPEGTSFKRVSFNSITKNAVQEALKHPRDINLALVDAQQARRLLDRIVGYKISPILNRRIQRGREGFVSAGRVQSVALKLVVDREKEIDIFVPVEYWNLAAILEAEETSFRANLYSVDGKRVEKEAVPGKDVFLISDKQTADAVISRMEGGPYTVISVEKKEKKRNPVPPFITSTLQQEASRHYGFSSAKTMNIAQGLYEGVDLGNEGAEGLITYMRTDSFRIAPEIIPEIRQVIQEKFGEEMLPAEPRVYTSKKAAQDAHEAIRPTNLKHPPEVVESFLTREQFMLYKLIWRRFLASQMKPAIYDTVSADIDAGDHIVVRATGSTMKFRGFLAVYEEKTDEEEKKQSQKEDILPDLYEGQQLTLLELTSDQAFTRPPPRYTEASLVKELEKSGIGRPSTYAAIMNKIQSREYTIKESGRLKPTELGRVIAQMLESNFQQIMNIGFTAQMEDALEMIAANEKDWKALIRDFWKDFLPTLETAEKEAFVPKVMTDVDCPTCGAKLQKVWFKSKYFYGCSRYPDCTYSAPAEEIMFSKEDYADDFNWEQKCPLCESEMKIRHGRFGAFLGCSRYPKCRGIVNIPKKGEEIIPVEELPECPAIDCIGHIVARKSRFGKTFYSCSTFPECDVIVNDLAQLQSKYAEHPRTPYVKKTRGKKGAPKKEAPSKGGKRKTRVAAPSHLSPELQKIVGAAEATRGEALKKVWAYIKSHELQDKENKRLIVPDEKLAQLFGTKDPLDMFKIAGILSQHIGKKTSE